MKQIPRAVALVAMFSTLAACTEEASSTKKVSLPPTPTSVQAPASPGADAAEPATAAAARFTGTFEARRSSGVAATVGGVIREVHVQEGDAVKTGDPLLDIDAATYRLHAEQAEAAVEAAKAQIGLLQTEYDRAQQLLAKQAIAPSQVDQLRGQLQGAQAQLRQAEVGLKMARKSRADSLVRAPFDGVVTRVNVAVGEFAAPGPMPLMEIDEQDLILRAQIPAEHVDELVVGGRLRARVPALDRELEMKIERVNPRVAQHSRSFDVIAVAAAPDASLRAGMFAEVFLPAGGNP